jgi:hypothetical protein
VANDKETEILLKAKNVTEQAFREVRAALKELGDQQRKVTDDGKSQWGGLFEKMSGSKVISDANALTQVIGQIGGATKLTDAEQKRVNATLTEALAKYRALGQQAPADVAALADAMKKAEDSTSRFNRVSSDLGDHVKTMALGFISAQAVIAGVQVGFRVLSDFLTSSVEAYASAEAAAKKMTVALQAQGTATPGVIAHFNNLAAQFQRTTVYSDDLINQMEALLTEVGQVTPREMEKALTASTNLASGLGIDLQGATMLVAKAFAGGGDELGRLKAILGDTYKPGMDMAAVLEAINAKFGGQAQSELETYSGRLKQLVNDWDNAKEAVGKSIVADDLLQASLRLASAATLEASQRADGASVSFVELWTRLATGSESTATLVRVLEAYANAANRAEETTRHYTAAMKSAEEMQGLIAAALTPPANAASAYASFVQKLDEAKTAYKGLSVEVKANFAAASELKAKDDELMAILGTRDSGVLAVAKDAYAQHTKAINDSIAKVKEHGKAVDDVVDTYTGQAKKVAELSEAFTTVKRSASTDDLRNFAVEVGKVAAAGGRLTPELTQLAIQFGTLGTAAKWGAEGIADFGFKIEAAIPKLSEFNEAILDLQKKTKLGADGIPDFGFKVGNGFDEAAKNIAKDAKDSKKVLDELSQSFAQLSQVAGDSLDGVVRTLGTLVVAAKTAKEGIDAIGKGQKAGGFTGALEMASGIAGIASAAIAAGKAIKEMFAGTAGRDAVKSWVAENYGNFDGFQKKLQELVAQQKLTSAAADEMWRSLTQGVGRGDAAQAKQIIGDIEKRLGSLPASLEEMAAAAGYQTRASLQATAADAKRLYDYMVSSGEYAAAQIGDAFTKMQQAQDAAMDEMSVALRKTRDGAKAVVDGLDQQLKSLQDSIANEAPEDVMGIVEANTRAQIEAVTKQRKDAQDALDQVNQQIRDAADAAVAAAQQAAEGAGKATVDAVREALENEEFHLRIHLDADGSPSGASIPPHADGAYIREDHVARVHAGEIVGPADFMTRALAAALVRVGAPAAAAPAAPQRITLVDVNGRVIAEAVGDSVQRYRR